MARTEVCGKVSTIVLAAMSRDRAYDERELTARAEPLTLQQVRDAVKYQHRLGRVEPHGWSAPRKGGRGARKTMRWRLRA